MSTRRRQHSPEDLRRIKALRLIDDDFMSIFFDGYIEGAELLLRIILERDDLKVTEVKTQKQFKNISGRSVCLDIYASDSTGENMISRFREQTRVPLQGGQDTIRA